MSCFVCDKLPDREVIASWALGCPRGFVAAAPTNGRANARLRDALRAAGTAGALLNVSTSHFPLPRSYIKFSKNLPLLR